MERTPTVGLNNLRISIFPYLTLTVSSSVNWMVAFVLKLEIADSLASLDNPLVIKSEALHNRLMLDQFWSVLITRVSSNWVNLEIFPISIIAWDLFKNPPSA
jgi:hypothetical protein